MRECSAVAVRPGGGRTFPNRPLATSAQPGAYPRTPAEAGASARRRLVKVWLPCTLPMQHTQQRQLEQDKKSLGAGSRANAAAGAFIPPPSPRRFRVMYYVDCGGRAVERYMVCMRPKATSLIRRSASWRLARVYLRRVYMMRGNRPAAERWDLLANGRMSFWSERRGADEPEEIRRIEVFVCCPILNTGGAKAA